MVGLAVKLGLGRACQAVSIGRNPLVFRKLNHHRLEAGGFGSRLQARHRIGRKGVVVITPEGPPIPPPLRACRERSASVSQLDGEFIGPRHVLEVVA